MHPERFQVSGFRIQVKETKLATCNLQPATFLLYCLWLILLGDGLACAADVTAVVDGMQRRYASVQAVTGNFQQTYRAPGIDQVESGVFWLKKPALMRWEYRSPEEKLFVADGRESYLYVPQDRQVTVQPLNAADLRNTPLELLFGTREAYKNYTISWEADFKPQVERTYLIRLTPRRSDTGYSFLILELERETYDLRRFTICESSGNTSEFLFTNLILNAKIKDKEFEFRIPKGVEVIRLTDNP